MRIIGIVVIVLVLALGGLPFYFGMRAESEYNNIVEITSRSGNIEIEKSEYKRGWLSSRAETEYIISQNGQEFVRVREEDKIYHGPIPIGLLSEGKTELRPVMAVIDSSATLSMTGAPEYDDIIKKMPPMNVYTVISIDGSGNSLISIPAESVMMSSGDEVEKVNWKGLRGTVDFSSGLRKVETGINSPGIDIESKEVVVTISGIEGRSSITYSGDNYQTPLGTATGRIDELSFKSTVEKENEIDSLTFSDMTFTGETTENGESFNSSASFGAEKIVIDGTSYGPLVFEMAMRNIDKTAWSKFNAALQQSQGSPEGAGSEEMSKTFSALLPDFIRQSPEIEITKLSFKSPDGGLEGHAIIKIDGSGLGDNPDMAENPLFLIMAASASTDLTVSKPLLNTILNGFDKENQAGEESNPTIKSLLEQKYIVEDGNDYKFSAEYSMGNISVNGVPLDMGSLLMGQ